MVNFTKNESIYYAKNIIVTYGLLLFFDGFFFTKTNEH